MGDKRFSAAVFCALVCTLAAAVIAAAAGSCSAPAACVGTKAPQAAVTGFFDALCAGDTQLADSYVVDYSGLGLDGEIASPFEKRLYDELMASYSYTLSGDLRSQPGSRCYVQTVSFTHLDLERASDGVDEVFQEVFKEAETQFAFEELYNEEGSYSQPVIDLAIDKTADSIFADRDSLYVTEDIDVEIQYSLGKWRIVVSERLADAILGGTEDAA